MRLWDSQFTAYSCLYRRLSLGSVDRGNPNYEGGTLKGPIVFTSKDFIVLHWKRTQLFGEIVILFNERD